MAWANGKGPCEGEEACEETAERPGLASSLGRGFLNCVKLSILACVRLEEGLGLNATV